MVNNFSYINQYKRNWFYRSGVRRNDDDTLNDSVEANVTHVRRLGVVGGHLKTVNREDLLDRLDQQQADSQREYQVSIFLKKWANPGRFFFIFIFSIQLTVNIQKYDWIRTADLWSRKLYQLSHNNCSVANLINILQT